MSGSRRLTGCNTSIWFSLASCLTGLAVSFRPRPAGRSGWVSTASGRTPAPMSAASEARAKSGVPANSTRGAVKGAITVAESGDLRLQSTFFEEPLANAAPLGF